MHSEFGNDLDLVRLASRMVECRAAELRAAAMPQEVAVDTVIDVGAAVRDERAREERRAASRVVNLQRVLAVAAVVDEHDRRGIRWARTRVGRSAGRSLRTVGPQAVVRIGILLESALLRLPRGQTLIGRERAHVDPH